MPLHAVRKIEPAAQSFVTNSNSIDFGWNSIDEAFPDVDPGQSPLGASALFQIRHPKLRTRGGILLSTEDRATEYYNTQVAKVIALGPACFKAIDRETNKLVDWPEGQWFTVGNFVRLPKYGGDRFDVEWSYEDYEIDDRTGKREKVTRKDKVVFAIFKVKDVIAKVTADPLSLRSFWD